MVFLNLTKPKTGYSLLKLMFVEFDYLYFCILTVVVPKNTAVNSYASNCLIGPIFSIVLLFNMFTKINIMSELF